MIVTHCLAQFPARLVVGRRLVILRLVKEKVGSKFFVLITGKVSLDSLISIESEAAQLERVSYMSI